MPVHTPALNIPWITLQPDKVTKSTRKIESKTLFFICFDYKTQTIKKMILFTFINEQE